MREGELRFAGAANTTSNKTGKSDGYYSIEGAYALPDHIGVIGNLAYNPRSLDSTNTSMFSYEVGAGYYYHFHKYGCLEAYGGMGFGRLHSNFLSRYDSYVGLWSYRNENGGSYTQQDAYYTRPFVQINFGGEGDVFGIAFSLKASYLMMEKLEGAIHQWSNRVQYDSLGQERSYYEASDSSFSTRHSQLFWDPGITTRIGKGPLKAVFNLWWTDVSGKEPSFLWGSTSTSLGLSYTLDR